MTASTASDRVHSASGTRCECVCVRVPPYRGRTHTDAQTHSPPDAPPRPKIQSPQGGPMTAHDPDEPEPVDRYDIAARLLDAAAQAALKGRYDRVQVRRRCSRRGACSQRRDPLERVTPGA